MVNLYTFGISSIIEENGDHIMCWPVILVFAQNWIHLPGLRRLQVSQSSIQSCIPHLLFDVRYYRWGLLGYP